MHLGHHHAQLPVDGHEEIHEVDGIEIHLLAQRHRGVERGRIDLRCDARKFGLLVFGDEKGATASAPTAPAAAPGALTAPGAPAKDAKDPKAAKDPKKPAAAAAPAAPAKK